MRVEVRIRNKLVKSVDLPVRKPVVSASLIVDGVPESLPPGIEVPVKVVVKDKGSELPVLEYRVCGLGDSECFSVHVRSGNSVSKVIKVGPGTHVLKLLHGNEVVDSVKLLIERAPLKPDIVPTSDLKLLYPYGGVLRFFVKECNGAPFELIDLKVSLVPDEKVISRYVGGEVEIKVGELKHPVNEAVIALYVGVRDVFGGVWKTEKRFRVSVVPSPEFITSLKGRIEHLVRESESLAKSGELRNALLTILEAIAKCREYEAFIECGDIEGKVDAIVSEGPAGAVYFAILDVLSSPKKPSMSENILKPVLDRLKGIIDKVSKDVEGRVKLAREFINKGELFKALSTVKEAVNKCSDVGLGKDSVSKVDACSEALKLYDEVYALVDEVKEFLTRDVVISMPQRTRLGWFKIEVMARNSLARELTNVFIDFTPSRHYLELPKEKFILPPLYPGMEIAREIRVRSLFVGTIVIPYRVCLGDLCVDKKGKVVVGSLAAKETTALGYGGFEEANLLVGKSVQGLELLNLGPRKVQHLPSEVTINEYVCTHLLGSGGFSVTLLCSRGGMNAVLKIPPEAYWILLSGGAPDVETLHLRDDLLKAFDREARVLRELKHPNVVKLIEYGIQPFPYLAFEYCELGELRRAMTAAARLKPKVALEVMIPVTAAVAAAHAREKPIVHMDIKPENILITRDYVPKLTDFNIARIIGTVSRTSAGKGYTQGYAAPEQLGIEGYPPPSTYTDVFALGVVLYELITGVRPYPIETYQNNFRNPPKPKPPSQLNPETPRDLDDILQITLQLNPDDRYRDATQLLKDLWDTYQQNYYG